MPGNSGSSRRTPKASTPTAKVKFKCALSSCSTSAEDTLTCSSCKSIDHRSCSEVNVQLIKLLNESCDNGLTWFWHRNPCKELKTKFIPKTELSEISEQLKSEMKQDLATIKDEMKTEIDALRSILCFQIN